MSFFRSLGRLFGIGGTTNSALSIMEELTAGRRAEDERKRGLRNQFAPRMGFIDNRSTLNDSYLFSDGAVNERIRSNTAALFKEETGKDLIRRGQSGYDAQQSELDEFISSRRGELAAGADLAQTGVEGMRRARLNNQTGGVRNGIARNPFNMNMMRGPQANSTPRPRSTPAATPGAMGGGGGGGFNNYLLR